MKRRHFFQLAGGIAGALACSGKQEQNEMTVPWHMWGSDQPFQVEIVAGSIPGKASSQLANVQYKRPETWRFLLYASVGAVQTVDAGDLQIDVFFDLTLGIGRSTSVITPFAHLQWTVNNATQTGLNQTFFLTEAIGPKRLIAEAVGQNRVELVPAQTIQCAARMQISAGAPWIVNGVAGALFAPNAHIRPEWFKGQFPGGEDRTPA